MPRSPEPTRRRILEAAYALFHRHGFGRVGVDEIAAAARITKRAMYRHFASKDALLEAVLVSQHTVALARIRTWGDLLGTDMPAMIDQLFANLASWSQTAHWTGSGFTRLAMELADLPGHPARTIASRHKAALEAWLADRFTVAGIQAPQERAREVVLLLEGTMALMLIHGDQTYAAAARAAAHRLLGEAGASRLPS